MFRNFTYMATITIKQTWQVVLLSKAVMVYLRQQADWSQNNIGGMLQNVPMTTFQRDLTEKEKSTLKVECTILWTGVLY